jgi:Lipase (class 3)
MRIEVTPFAVEQAKLFADLIYNIRDPAGQGKNDALLNAYSPGLVKSKMVPAAGVNLGYYIGVYADAVYLMISGVSSVLTTALALGGYQLPSLESGYQPHNSYFEDQWARIWADVRAYMSYSPTKIYIGGWSAGGGTAFAGMANRSIVWTQSQAPTVHTFGSPKPFGTDLRTLAESRANIARWMNADDPIPLVPPTALDNPLSVPVVGIRASFAAGYYVQPHGGLILNSVGNITAGILPFNVVTNWTTSLVNWYFQWEQGGDPEHLISTYSSRLQLWLDRNAQLGTHGPIGGGDEVPVAIPRGTITRAQQAVAQTIVNLERTQNLLPVVVPPVNLFKAVRLARIWYVTFQGQVVALGGTKKGARRLAQNGNDFLRNLQNRPAVDIGTLEGALGSYLASASTNGADFVPVMNTVFPS